MKIGETINWTSLPGYTMTRTGEFEYILRGPDDEPFDWTEHFQRAMDEGKLAK